MVDNLKRELPKPGEIWYHYLSFDQERFDVLHIAQCLKTSETTVVFQSVKDEKVYTLLLEDFMEDVVVIGRNTPRFVRDE